MGMTVDDLVVGMIAQAEKNCHFKDPFTAPCPWQQQKYLDIQKSPKTKKVGILQQSPLLNVSTSVTRAMHFAERALIEHGYQIEYISLDDDIWRESREIFMGIAANALSPSIIAET